MAKPREIPGLDCSRASLAWISKILLTRFDEMAGFRHAALGFAEIKGVHDMRVAARRLRSALRDIEPFLAQEPIKDIKKELKAWSDALGAVRDRDVAIGALKKLSDESGSDAARAGIEELSKENVRIRNIARTDLTAIITAGNIDDLKKRFTSAIKEAATAADRISFNEAAGQMIAANLDAMLDLGPRLYKPFKRKGLHKLRIAAKRLRYSLELFALCEGSEAKSLAKEISRMQGFLGELHDADLWIEDLSGRLLSGASDGEHEAAAWLLPLFVRKQNKEYLSALALWEEWRKNNFTVRIRKVLSLP